MTQFLDASTAILKRADSETLCQEIFVHLSRHAPICGAAFPLFDKASDAHQAKFLGYAKVGCGGTGLAQDALAALVRPCSMRYQCMSNIVYRVKQLCLVHYVGVTVHTFVTKRSDASHVVCRNCVLLHV